MKESIQFWSESKSRGRYTNYFQNEWDLVAGLSVLPDSRGQRWLSEPDGERGVLSQKYFYVIEKLCSGLSRVLSGDKADCGCSCCMKRY